MIEVNNITVSYDDAKEVLNGLSLSVRPGERLAILGENGAGKTTLLHAIVGLLRLTSGNIIIDNLALNKGNMLEIRRRVGLVFQNPDDQLFMPTVLDDVAFAPINCKASVAEAEEKAEETLRDLGILELKDSSPLKLSGGEKRIVAIATVIVTNPKVLLFDEPTAYLDWTAKKKLAKILKSLQATQIIATHDIRFCCENCDRAIIMHDGKIKGDFPISQLAKSSDLLEDCGIETTGLI